MNETKRKLAIGFIILFSLVSGYAFSVLVLSAVVTGNMGIVSRNWRLLVLAALPPSALLVWRFRETVSSDFEKVGVGIRVGLLFLLLLMGWFYWFQYRPSKIRAACDKQATKVMGDVAAAGGLSNEGAVRLYNFWYDSCLRAGGIER